MSHANISTGNRLKCDIVIRKHCGCLCKSDLTIFPRTATRIIFVETKDSYIEWTKRAKLGTFKLSSSNNF